MLRPASAEADGLEQSRFRCRPLVIRLAISTADVLNSCVTSASEVRVARAEIQAGTLRGKALVERIEKLPASERDGWIDEVLDIDSLVADAPDLPRGSVPYLPCGVDEILATVRELPLRAEDHLVDLGSGLGRVLFIAHLVSGARATGVEIQGHLVHTSRAKAAAINLPISIIHGNAAENVPEGSVFFMYAPFNGPMLESVLARLENIAQRRRIALCTVGLELGEVPWLARRSTSCPSLMLHSSA